jgi:Flp pilus assembly protein TadG
MPVLALLALAGLDFSRAYMAGVTFVHAAEQGARYVSNQAGTDYSGLSPTPQELVLTALADADASQGGAGGFVNAKSLSGGATLSASDVSVTLGNAAGTVVASTTPESGYVVDVKVTGIVPFFSGFLINGVAGFAPGLHLCTGSGANTVCGIPITGEAIMVVL